MKQFFLISVFWLCHRQCETLATQSGIEPTCPTLEAWILNHWTTMEVMWGTFCGSNKTSSDDRSCGQSIFLPEYPSHPLPHALVLPILNSQPQSLIWPRWNAPDPPVICTHHATYLSFLIFFIVVVQSFICVPLFVTPRTAACQASVSFIVSQSLLKLMSIEWCHPTISYS